MKPQCILLANASVARLFLRDSPKAPLVPLDTLTHPEGRVRGSQLADDRPGHEATDNSPGGNRFEPRTDVRRKENARFARQVARRLETGLNAGEFGTLSLLASNPFLGELKAQLSDAVKKRMQLVLHTDLTALGISEIEQRLSDQHLGRV